MSSDGAGDLSGRPFLRWAGGKQALVSRLMKFLPYSYSAENGTYFEPFLGAGSLFLRLAPKRAVVSDLNRHLISVFEAIKSDPSGLSRQCKLHERRNSRSYYYRIRDLFNRELHCNNTRQASRFLYLNRAGFNGIFRVNTAGQYNVPYGNKNHLLMPDLAHLKSLSSAFRHVDFRICPFEETLEHIGAGDLVYLDPPYPPLNGTSYFTHYTKERFDSSDQERVAQFAKSISTKGGLVMITNADTDQVRSLYKEWNIHRVSSVRYVSCKSERHRVGELVITNYEGENNEA